MIFIKLYISTFSLISEKCFQFFSLFMGNDKNFFYSEYLYEIDIQNLVPVIVILFRIGLKNGINKYMLSLVQTIQNKD